VLQQSKSDLIEAILDDNFSRGVARNGVEIIIDRTKCNYSMYDPTGCKRCLTICPVSVYATRPIHKRDYSIPPKERVDPTKWIILPTWADWCNGCGACIEACPQKAITIKFQNKPICE